MAGMAATRASASGAPPPAGANTCRAPGPPSPSARERRRARAASIFAVSVPAIRYAGRSSSATRRVYSGARALPDGDRERREHDRGGRQLGCKTPADTKNAEAEERQRGEDAEHAANPTERQADRLRCGADVVAILRWGERASHLITTRAGPEVDHDGDHNRGAEANDERKEHGEGAHGAAGLAVVCGRGCRSGHRSRLGRTLIHARDPSGPDRCSSGSSRRRCRSLLQRPFERWPPRARQAPRASRTSGYRTVSPRPPRSRPLLGSSGPTKSRAW